MSENISAKIIFENHPRGANESIAAYSRRLSAIYPDYSSEGLRVKYNKLLKRDYVKTSVTYDAKGNVSSYVEKLQQNDIVNFDIPIKRVSTNVTTGQQWIIQENKEKDISYNEIIEGAINLIGRTPIVFKKSKSYENVVINNIITDVHAGMCPKDGYLNYEWNSKKLIECFEINLNDVLKFVDLSGGRVKELYIYDLGDDLDGFEGRTTRGTELPQNMTAEQQFALVLDVYITYIEELLKYDVADKIIIHRCENSNHSGSFSKILGYALESTIKKLYPNCHIEFKRPSDFLAYSIHGENAVVTTHGKDLKYMKSPLPYVLNSAWENYLISVFKHWGIMDKKISLYKGDQHRLGYSSHTMLEYYNFMAFSPPSGWIQHNFGATEDIGYSIHVLSEKRDNCSIYNKRFNLSN